MQEYWNWSWDQHAQYDLPAQVLYISTETNQPVHFIGLSQVSFITDLMYEVGPSFVNLLVIRAVSCLNAALDIYSGDVESQLSFRG